MKYLFALMVSIQLTAQVAGADNRCREDYVSRNSYTKIVSETNSKVRYNLGYDWCKSLSTPAMQNLVINKMCNIPPLSSDYILIQGVFGETITYKVTYINETGISSIMSTGKIVCPVYVYSGPSPTDYTDYTGGGGGDLGGGGGGGDIGGGGGGGM